jgi:hypothetical protein
MSWRSCPNSSSIRRFDKSATDGWHPAIYAVEEGGISIPGEVYELTLTEYEHWRGDNLAKLYSVCTSSLEDLEDKMGVY